MARTDVLSYQVRLTLGDYEEAYDIPAIVAELRDYDPDIKDIDDVPGDVYWQIVSDNERD